MNRTLLIVLTVMLHSWDLTPASELRLLTYNIHHGEGLDGKIDLDRIATLIKSQNPDLVALQEIDVKTARASGVDQAAELARLTAMHYAFGKFMDFDGGEYGQMILSKYPILSSENLKLPEGVEPRAAMIAHIKVPQFEGPIYFVGNHLYATEEQRSAQAQALVDRFKDITDPVILAGDFNSEPKSPPMQRLHRAGWVDPTLETDAGTFPANDPKREIDYVLHRPAARFSFVSSKVIKEPVASDHRPVLTVLETQRYNVLFIISDDLTSTALSCYGNDACHTPNIDAIAAQGTRFTRAYCQGTYCGPSRASLMSGYYPHATGVLGYENPRPQIGDRDTWPQQFKNAGYYTARISKIYHMGIPGDVEEGGPDKDYHGADDALSWTERFNSPGPEWMASGDGETLENNPDGKKPAVGGNTFVVVEADGDDLVHSDGKTAQKAAQLIEIHKDKPFWLGVGFVRPHVPFVAPRKYYEPFKPYDRNALPEKIAGDWDDIPKAGINYKTSRDMQMDLRQQQKAVGGYYASVSYMDAQVGVVMEALKQAGIVDKTIVIFTSDHGYHLGEHDFWAKVSLREESASVPLIISVPGKKPAVCHSLVELLDLYPTTAALCGLPVPDRLQGKNIAAMLDDPSIQVRDAAFSVAPMRKGFLLREDKWAYMHYEEDASKGTELFDMEQDPKQYTNLANRPEHAALVARLHARLADKLVEIRNHDLP